MFCLVDFHIPRKEVRGGEFIGVLVAKTRWSESQKIIVGERKPEISR